MNTLASIALEHIAKLKAERRAEIDAQKAAEEAAARDLVEKKASAWVDGVRNALAELGEAWLTPFRDATKDEDPFTQSPYRTFRSAAFSIPGHHTILLRVEDITCHNDFKWRTWPPAQFDWLATWAVRTGTAVEGYRTLADALIAAEQTGTDPIPF